MRIFSAMVLVAFGLNAAGQSFRVKPLFYDGKSIDFLMGPKAKVAPEGLFRMKQRLRVKPGSRFSFQYVYFKCLSAKYEASDVQVANAFYAHTKSGVLSGEVRKTSSPFYKLFVTGKPGEAVDLTVSFKQDTILKDIFSASWEDVEGFYHRLAKSLFIDLYKLEADFKLAPGISQRMVEELFDRMPLPQGVQLQKYLYTVSGAYSFVLVNPKVWLSVDSVRVNWSKDSLLNSPVSADWKGKKFWHFTLLGTSLVKFFRKSDGSLGTPYLNQAHFYDLSLGQVPANYVTLNRDMVLLASMMDMQQSTAISGNRFVGIYGNALLPNNNLSPIVVSANSEFAYYGSRLLFFNQFDTDFFSAAFSASGPKGNGVQSAVFGPRNPIYPVIGITFNEQDKVIPLNSSLYFLKQQGILPALRKFKLERVSLGKYYKVKGAANDFLLMPTDRLSVR